MNGAASMLVDFAGCDYLGLASHPDVVAAMCEAARGGRVGASASRWSIGWTDTHEQLEQELARFMRAEGACLLTSGYLGGAVYFTEMAREHHVVFCDEGVHSNQLLGMKAAGMAIRTFGHLDAVDLSRQLESYDGPPPIIATDGVYGMTGEVAPLAELGRLARRYGAELYVDDAHGIGVLGPSGRGAAEQAGLLPEGVTVLGSMSKALGCCGGFLAGRHALVERFRRSAAVSGSTPLPVPIAAACLAAFDVVRHDRSLRRRLDENAHVMRGALSACGVAVMATGSPILAMVMANADEANRMADHFLAHGIRAPHFAYSGESRNNVLRVIARSVYTADDLSRFADALRSRSDGAMGE